MFYIRRHLIALLKGLSKMYRISRLGTKMEPKKAFWGHFGTNLFLCMLLWSQVGCHSLSPCPFAAFFVIVAHTYAFFGPFQTFMGRTRRPNSPKRAENVLTCVLGSTKAQLEKCFFGLFPPFLVPKWLNLKGVGDMLVIKAA